MWDWPSDPFSGIFQDSEGHRLLAVFAARVPRQESSNPEGTLPQLDVVFSDSPLSELSDLPEDSDSDGDDDQCDDNDGSVYTDDDAVPEEVEEEEDGASDLPFNQEDLDFAKVPLPPNKPVVRACLLLIMIYNLFFHQMNYQTGPNGHPGRTEAALEGIEANSKSEDGFPVFLSFKSNALP